MQPLDAEPIAGNEQLLIAGIPDGKCPHPVEPQLTVGSPLCIGGGNNLGVAIRDKAMTEARQLLAQFQIIIDLSIVRDPVSPIGVGQGLSGGTGKIDGRETAMPEPKAGISPMLNCEIIRTSMCKTMGECLESVPGKICSR